MAMQPILYRLLFQHGSPRITTYLRGTSTAQRSRHLCTQPLLRKTYFSTPRTCLHRMFCASSTPVASLVSSDNIVRSPVPDIDIPTGLPFHEFIFQYCDQFKNLTAVEDFLTGRKYSYSQLKENAVKVASALHKMGYRKGDVILTFSPNTIDFTVLMLACAATGIWFSSANPSFTAKELSRQINHCDAKAVCCAQELTNMVKDSLADPEFPNQVKDLFVFGKSDGFQPFQNLVEDDGKSFPDVDINPMEDVYTLPYSSGTTGLPKGVMLTHYNCLANCLQIFGSSPTTPADRLIGLLPLYHIYGMIVVQFSVLIGGSSLFYLPKFVPETFLDCLQTKKITTAHLVPPLIVFLAKHPLVSNYDLSSLKKLICGAAPLGAEVTNELVLKYPHGLVINQGYGMTELSPVTNLDMTATAGSIGQLVANTQAKLSSTMEPSTLVLISTPPEHRPKAFLSRAAKYIPNKFVDVETNKTVGPGESGEYCIKGPQVMKGYYNNQQATDEMMEPDGWLHTGDIGYFDKDGLVYIHDRLKELIKYKGFQVPPAELEALLLGHSDIHDVAVLGIPDSKAGELPRAFVVKKPGSTISEQEIVQFVQERIANQKWLRGGIQFVEEIPKNPSGKILRRILREKYL